MNHLCRALAVGLTLNVCGLPLASAGDRGDEASDDERYAVDDQSADQVADQVVERIDGPQLPDAPAGLSAPAPAASVAAVVPSKEQVKVDAINSHKAAEVAKQAAVVANRVAEHSVKVTGHAKQALKHALGALHDARVQSSGLGAQQKDSLKKAEAHLREATKAADYGKLKKVQSSRDLQKDKMQAELDKNADKSKAGPSEKEQMRQEIQDLRKKLRAKKQDDKDIDHALDDLEADVGKTDDEGGQRNDELKAELERLREQADQLEEADQHVTVEYEIPAARPKEATKASGETQDMKAGSGAKLKPLSSDQDGDEVDGAVGEAAAPIESKGIDIDTAMPYGELEPFGREDTAQELTEQSISESNEMVDQLERAEVAEEKRSVFRALTRLRGAAITSFDGVARSQTGNIDEYNKIHKWRATHPLHHLADEESDVSKWAFPDNAD